MAEPKANMLTQFNAGEFSNALAGRVDYARLKSSLRKAVNVIPEVAGGLKKFYGTKFISEIENAQNFCMIPFHHEDANFTLVFYDGKVGLIKNGIFADLGMAAPAVKDYQSIRYEQANDVIICVAEDAAPFRIAYYGQDTFVIESIAFSEVPYFPFGYTGDYSGELNVSGTSGEIVAEIPGSELVDKIYFGFPSSLSRTGDNNITGNLYCGWNEPGYGSHDSYPTLGNITISLVKEKNGTETVVKSIVKNNVISSSVAVSGYRVKWKSGGTTTTEPINTLRYKYNSLSYASYVASIKSLFAGTNEDERGLFLLTSSIPGYDSTAEYKFIVSRGVSSCTPSTEDKLFTNSNITDVTAYLNGNGILLYSDTMSHYSSPGKFVAGADAFPNTTALIGRKIKFYQDVHSDAVKVWYQGLNIAAGDVNKLIVLSDGHYYLAESSGSCGNIKPTHTSGVVSDGVVNWRYLHSGTTTATITGVDSSTRMRLVVDNNEYLPVARLGESTYKFTNYRWSMWGAEGVFPSQVFFCEGRLGFITNTSYGTYYSLSKTDSYFDFREDTYGKTLDTDSITGLVSGGHVSNRVNWVIAREKVYMGSYGTEFVLGGNNDNITPTTVYCKPVSFTGGDKIQALKYMTMSLFVGANAKELYTVNYDYATESYIPTNVSYVSEHLLSDKIKKLAGAPRPDKTIYILSKDGRVTQFINYITEQVAAFSELDLGGKVIDIAVSYSGNNTEIDIAKEKDGLISLEKFSIDEPCYTLSEETIRGDSGLLYGWYDGEGEVLFTREFMGDLRGESVYFSDGTERPWTILGAMTTGNDILISKESASSTLYRWQNNYAAQVYGLPDVIYTTVLEPNDTSYIFSADGSYNNLLHVVSGDASVVRVVKTTTGETIDYVRAAEGDIPSVDVQEISAYTRDSSWDTEVVFKEIKCPRLAGREVWVKYVPYLGTDVQFKKVTLDERGEYTTEDGLTEYTIGLPMPMEVNTQPLSGAKLEGFQQSSIRVLFRLLNTGHFSYGCSNDEEKYIDFDPWSVKQEYERAHDLATGDVQLDIPYGYMKKSNVADSIYPNNTGVGINIRSDSPEPFNLLLISEIYK